jgi:hypothetical protein
MQGAPMQVVQGQGQEAQRSRWFFVSCSKQAADSGWVQKYWAVADVRYRYLLLLFSTVYPNGKMNTPSSSIHPVHARGMFTGPVAGECAFMQQLAPLRVIQFVVKKRKIS